MKLPPMLLEQVVTVLRPLAEKWLDWMNVNRSMSLSMSQRHGMIPLLKSHSLEESTARSIWWLVAALIIIIAMVIKVRGGAGAHGYLWRAQIHQWILAGCSFGQVLICFGQFLIVFFGHLIGCWSVFSLRLGTHVISVIMNLGQEVAVQRIVEKNKMGDP